MHGASDLKRQGGDGRWDSGHTRITCSTPHAYSKWCNKSRGHLGGETSSRRPERLSGRAATVILTSFRAPIPSFGSLLAFGRALSASLAFCMFCVTTRVQGSGVQGPKVQGWVWFRCLSGAAGSTHEDPDCVLETCADVPPLCASVKHSLKSRSPAGRASMRTAANLREAGQAG